MIGMTAAMVITRMARKRSTASLVPSPARIIFWRMPSV